MNQPSTGPRSAPEEFEFKDQTFTGTEQDSAYVVESEKAGSRAAHHESGLGVLDPAAPAR